MLAGSPPRAMTTGILSPRSAIVRQCAAPTLCRCQCIASVSLFKTWTRYIPTLRTPEAGSRVMTPPSVMYGPPSSGQQIGTGNWARSTSDSLITVFWQAGRPTVLGGNFAISASRGSIASFSSRPSGTLSAISSAIRAPAWSIAATNSRRLSSAIMDGADAAGQALEADARESRSREPLRQCLRLRKCEHRLWQVGIGLPMFRHQPADGGQNSPEVEEVDRAQRREPWRGELENDETRAGFQNPGRFAEAAGEVGGKVEGAGTEIEVGAVGFSFPAEARHGGAPPGPIHVEAEQVVQEVVARSDLREHATDVGWRTTHRRERWAGPPERRQRSAGR